MGRSRPLPVQFLQLRLGMRRMGLSLIALAALACPSAHQSMDQSNATSTVSTSGTEATGTASRTSTGASGGTISSLDAEDKKFFVDAAQDFLAEVTFGRIAQTSAVSADVKRVADQVVSDSSRATDEMKQIAITKGLALPADLAFHDAKTKDSLSHKVAKDFDTAYISSVIATAQKDVTAFERASRDAKDPDLKAWASKTLPSIQADLQSAKEAAAKLE